MSNFFSGINDITILTNGKTRSINAENPTGEPGKGAMAMPTPESWCSMLGRGWKTSPCLRDVPAHSNIVLADIEGPGKITHIWITFDHKFYRECILRMYWDDEETPSVEVPVGDLFCNGHGIRANVNSLPLAVNPSGGFNSYWPMPFRKHARIEVEHQGDSVIEQFYFQIMYELDDVPEDAGYFHAQWRRSVTPGDKPDHVIVDGIKGKGHYIGTYLAWAQLSDGWWGEGEVKFYMDGDGEFPTICGTGVEDYFGGAWGFLGPDGKAETYSTAFLGYPLCRKPEGEIPKHSLYRWHIPDPIRFETDLKVTVQALGWWPTRKLQGLRDDISSVGYWYQAEPHAEFPKLPPVPDRWPR